MKRWHFNEVHLETKGLICYVSVSLIFGKIFKFIIHLRYKMSCTSLFYSFMLWRDVSSTLTRYSQVISQDSSKANFVKSELNKNA